MDIVTYINKNRPLLAKHIDDYLKKIYTQSPSDLVYFSRVIDSFRAFVPEGKLFRGLQVMMGYQINGGELGTTIFDVATAVELIHSTLLIHDDIMDNDMLRRGKKALFAEFTEQGQTAKVSNALLYGQSMAICAGDIGFFLAYELIAGSRYEPKILLQTLRNMSRELQYVGAMQMSDVDLGMLAREPSEDEIISVYRFKTGRYTIAMPLVLGAQLAHAPDALVSQFDVFGEELGILFQMRDDELSLFGDEQVTGKPVGSDIRENKKTLIRHLLFKHADPSEITALRSIFGKFNLHGEDIRTVQNIYSNSTARKILQERSRKMLTSLHMQIDKMAITSGWQTLLHTFTDYIVERNK